ncbi:hypothetical protein ACP275_12G049400 [Erythranthe tilingii]
MVNSHTHKNGSHLLSLFAILGTIVSLVVYLSPAVTFRRIRQLKSTTGYLLIPYVVALFSSAIWLYYGVLDAKATTLISINAFGCLVEFVYICMYFYYSAYNYRVYTVKVIGLVSCILCSFILLTNFTWKGNTMLDIVGWFCLGASVLVYGATLGTVVRAIKSGSVEFIPITLTCVLTGNATIWGIYGFLLEDDNILVPNIVGFILGVGQISVYLKYRTQTVAAGEVAATT